MARIATSVLLGWAAIGTRVEVLVGAGVAVAGLGDAVGERVGVWLAAGEGDDGVVLVAGVSVTAVEVGVDVSTTGVMVTVGSAGRVVGVGLTMTGLSPLPGFGVCVGATVGGGFGVSVGAVVAAGEGGVAVGGWEVAVGGCAVAVGGWEIAVGGAEVGVLAG